MSKIIPIILFLVSPVCFALDAPKLTARVNDNAGIFTADERQKLEDKLKAHEDASTDQIAILTVASLEGETIESFSMKVAQAWKIGTKKNDNGVIVVYAPNDHKIRIEVGRGLEGRLTDGVCGEIIRDKFAPSTKAKRYYEGFDNGTTGVIQSIAGEYKAGSGGVAGKASPLWWVWGIAAFIVLCVSTAHPHAGVAMTTGGVLGLITGVAIGGWAILWCAVVGVIIGLLFKAVGGGSDSWSGSSWSSSSGSDSSWGGGGGLFDGGGASGDA